MRILWVVLVATVVTLRWGTRILWAAWRRPDDMDDICWNAPRSWSGALLRAAGVDVEIHGVEHLHPDRPGILVANHESWYDVLALAAHLPVMFRFVGKKELTRVPLFGPAWQACGHVAIDRSDHEAAIRSLDRAGELLRREGGVIILFPEGTRSRTEEMLPFKKGPFVLALKLGVPIIPVGISGSREVMPKGSLRIRPGTIGVHIGEPLPVKGLTEGDRDDLIRRTRVVVDSLRKRELSS